MSCQSYFTSTEVNKMNCPECNSTTHSTIAQEVICNNCGLVLEDAPLEQHALLSAPAANPSLAIAGTFQYDGKVVKTSWLFSTRQKNQALAKRHIQVLTHRLHLPERVSTEALVLFT